MQNIFTVTASDVKGDKKRVTVSSEKGGKVHLLLHRYAQVGKGDSVYVDPEHPEKISVVAIDQQDDLIKVTPYFHQEVQIKSGAIELQGLLTEINSNSDVQGYEYLEAFHYKSSVVPSDGDEEPEKFNGGRRAVLLLKIKNGKRWEAIGYIELQMPLLMVKPRHEIFAYPFKHSKYNCEWNAWDQAAIKNNVNKIVRIARIVTSPEYRGLGISRVLIEGAKRFARERWHIGGKRPVFIEISAEMLRHIDFVSQSRLYYAGNTEGNLQRVFKDMTYMQRNYDISSGIMSLQKKYLNSLLKGADALGKTPDEMLQLVSKICDDPSQAASLTLGEYYCLKSVLRFPIPYFIGGLDAETDDYLKRAIESAREKNPSRFSQEWGAQSLKIAPGKIAFSDINISTIYKIPRNKHVQSIMDCFGLVGESIKNTVISNLPLEASGGNIIFIDGASGTGKSLLLAALDQDKSISFVENRLVPKDKSKYTAGWMRDLPPDIPLIEYFASRANLERALTALNQAGLSEAYVYLKPFSLLSRGQKYRARLADLALREDQVWLIDEFCADLDPLSAKIVANNLRKHVQKYQRIAVVAAANNSHFLDALRPTRIIRLRHGFSAEIYTYKDYIDEFHAKAI